ncbi:hypothetical protein CKA32_000318 [Geitlerinema sp. FC II]|nr:hypothetical protein CKA32_000318 [Geitlerinema sp. FC II]
MSLNPQLKRRLGNFNLPGLFILILLYLFNESIYFFVFNYTN